MKLLLLQDWLLSEICFSIFWNFLLLILLLFLSLIPWCRVLYPLKELTPIRHQLIFFFYTLSFSFDHILAHIHPC